MSELIPPKTIVTTVEFTHYKEWEVSLPVGNTSSDEEIRQEAAKQVVAEMLDKCAFTVRVQFKDRPYTCGFTTVYRTKPDHGGETDIAGERAAAAKIMREGIERAKEPPQPNAFVTGHPEEDMEAAGQGARSESSQPEVPSQPAGGNGRAGSE